MRRRRIVVVGAKGSYSLNTVFNESESFARGRYRTRANGRKTVQMTSVSLPEASDRPLLGDEGRKRCGWSLRGTGSLRGTAVALSSRQLEHTIPVVFCKPAFRGRVALSVKISVMSKKVLYGE